MSPDLRRPSLARRLGPVSHRVIASLVFGAVAAAVPSDGRAQTAPTQNAPVQLPRISVEGQKGPAPDDYKVDRPSSNKLTEPLVDTPQIGRAHV